MTGDDVGTGKCSLEWAIRMPTFLHPAHQSGTGAGTSECSASSAHIPVSPADRPQSTPRGPHGSWATRRSALRPTVVHWFHLSAVLCPLPLFLSRTLKTS